MEARHAHIASPADSSFSSLPDPTPKPISCTLPLDDDYYFFFLLLLLLWDSEREREKMMGSISLSHHLVAQPIVFDWNVRRPLRNHRLRRHHRRHWRSFLFFIQSLYVFVFVLFFPFLLIDRRGKRKGRQNTISPRQKTVHLVG